MNDEQSSASGWDFGDTREDLIHRIHPYPARFPAFITTKALDFAERHGVTVRIVADVFCGCGTTAVEAKRRGKNFWGCDINPLATLIAKVKTHHYRDLDLERTYHAITAEACRSRVTREERVGISERIRYWFDDQAIDDLVRLDRAIRTHTQRYSAHRRFFQCGFSAILKATSYWLTKSIKPQRDPNKEPRRVMEAFEERISFMRLANIENSFPRPAPTTEIRTRNFLGHVMEREKTDLIVTSPPYVTSYNYADIHQLSLLWLGYAKDYRDLRKNMLGNRYGIRVPPKALIRKLGDTPWRTYRDLQGEDRNLASSVARYFINLDKAVWRCESILKKGGMAVFVIGNTKYRGVNVNNVELLKTSMRRAGFNELYTIPRRVSLKTMTPYRDARGRFTRDSGDRKVYAREFVVTGKKS